MTLIDKMSNYLENKLLDHWLVGNSYTAPTNVWFAIGTSDAAESDQTSWSGECAGTGYQRQQMEFHPARSRTNGDSYSLLRDKIEFTAGTGWPSNLNYFTIWDAQTGGNILFRGDLEREHDLSTSGNKLVIPAGELSVRYRSSTFSHYLRRELLDHVLRGESYTIPDKYAALAFELPKADQTGGDLNEPSTAGYTRILHNNWNLTANDADNNGSIDFPQATANYPDKVRAAALADASSGGNLLVFNSLELPGGGPGIGPPGHTINIYDDPTIPDASMEIGMN